MVLTGSADAYAVDEAATAKLRAELRVARKGPLPLIDRGPGFEKMLRGGGNDAGDPFPSPVDGPRL